MLPGWIQVSQQQRVKGIQGFRRLPLKKQTRKKSWHPVLKGSLAIACSSSNMSLSRAPGMRKNGFKFYSLIKWLSPGLIALGTIKCELNYSPTAFFIQLCGLWLCHQLQVSGCWMKEKKKKEAPTRNQMTVTTDHPEFSKCNPGTIEWCKMQAHFPWQFQVEVNVCKTYFDLAEQSNLCSWNVFVCIIQLLFLFFLISFLPTQSIIRFPNHT